MQTHADVSAAFRGNPVHKYVTAPTFVTGTRLPPRSRYAQRDMLAGWPSDNPRLKRGPVDSKTPGVGPC
jgi:hypothetical protein